MINLAILASHNGSAVEPIIYAIDEGKLALNLQLIITNNSDAKVLQKEKKHNIHALFINANTTQDQDALLLETLHANNIQLIFLAGYMKKISEAIIKDFFIINSHPALLPKYGGKGMYGHFVHEAVIQNKEKESGVTIHQVNENYDEGAIIVQNSLKIASNEDSNSLQRRIKELEKSTITDGLQRCLKQLNI